VIYRKCWRRLAANRRERVLTMIDQDDYFRTLKAHYRSHGWASKPLVAVAFCPHCDGSMCPVCGEESVLCDGCGCEFCEACGAQVIDGRTNVGKSWAEIVARYDRDACVSIYGPS
jgi:hypothetical protein